MSKKKTNYSAEFKAKAIGELFRIIDWYTRQIAGCELSYSLEKTFVMNGLKRALKHRKPELIRAVERYIRFYNSDRPHQSLAYKTPNEVSRQRPSYHLAA